MRLARTDPRGHEKSAAPRSVPVPIGAPIVLHMHMESLTREFLDKYGLSNQMRDKFLSSIDKIFDEDVDLHLGNHLSNNNHREKQERLTDEYNPFVEENTYKSFLRDLRKRAIDAFND
jgi:hypothetical protein